jgi:hypothetical protein
MTDLALKPTGGTTSPVNNGTLNGVVKLGNPGNQMTNSGLWLTAERQQQFFVVAPPSGDTIVAGCLVLAKRDDRLHRPDQFRQSWDAELARWRHWRRRAFHQ